MGGWVSVGGGREAPPLSAAGDLFISNVLAFSISNEKHYFGSSMQYRFVPEKT